ncbi:MAG: ferritin-like protein, partial [Cyclobacteriaceae bacterium]
MLKINPQIIRGVQQASELADLHQYMQLAIELEHATIPPYLTAMFSIKHGKMKEAREVIHSIVIEEMMHMTISANILNALGGSPSINTKDFVPAYPGKLPMNIGSGLTVGLQKYSKKALEETFMIIEEPEHPHHYPEKNMLEAEIEDFATIGQFYEAMSKKIMELPGDDLPGDPDKQVTSSFLSAVELFP